MSTENQKMALITGASRGIGRVVAAGLASDGYNVALISRSEDLLNSVAKEIETETGQKVIACALDVADERAVSATVVDIADRLGPVDVLVNNAGINKVGTLNLSAEDLRSVLNVNLVGAFNVLKAVVPLMTERKSGTIVNVSSISGKVGFAGGGVYSASKFGLLGLNESLYHELTTAGVRVTAICPSWVATDLASYASIAKEQMIPPEDILQTVRFLTSLSPNTVIKEVVLDCAHDSAC